VERNSPCSLGLWVFFLHPYKFLHPPHQNNYRIFFFSLIRGLIAIQKKKIDLEVLWWYGGSYSLRLFREFFHVTPTFLPAPPNFFKIFKIFLTFLLFSKIFSFLIFIYPLTLTPSHFSHFIGKKHMSREVLNFEIKSR